MKGLPADSEGEQFLAARLRPNAGRRILTFRLNENKEGPY